MWWQFQPLAVKKVKLKSYIKENKRIKLTCPYRRPLDQAIQPLVDAMNSTDLFTTFSSCAGHFPPPPNNPYKGIRAMVLFQTIPIKDEKIIEDLIVFIEQENERSHSRLFCSIRLSKDYVAYREPQKSKYIFSARYCLEIFPRLTSVTDATKRRDVDVGIAVLTKIFTRFPLARR